MRNFFIKTLYQKRHVLLFWFLGIAAVTMLTVSFYHTFRASDLDQVLKSLPAPIKTVAGNISSFKTVDGYLRQQVYVLRLPLLTIILAITLLAGVTGGDEQKGLLETQLSLPVSRTKLLLQKLVACLLILALASLGAVVGSAVALSFLKETLPLMHVLEYTANCITIATVYGLIPFTIACVTGRRSIALGVGSGFAFTSYLLNSMAPSVSSLATIDKLTFFHYYQNAPFAFKNIIVLLVTIVVLITVSIIGFNRRDIRAN